MEEARILLEASAPPNDETIRRFINQYTVADDAYDVAVDIGKQVGWSQSQIEKAEKIIKRKYLPEGSYPDDDPDDPRNALDSEDDLPPSMKGHQKFVAQLKKNTRAAMEEQEEEEEDKLPLDFNHPMPDEEVNDSPQRNMGVTESGQRYCPTCGSADINVWGSHPEGLAYICNTCGYMQQAEEFLRELKEDFNLGKSVEWRKAKNKWSLSERTLNAIVSRLNKDYVVWKENIKWYQERSGRWNLYVKNPTGMEGYISQIEDDIKVYDL